MTKQAFLAALRARLEGLPEEEVKERMSFYAEMIDDRIEDGVSEEAAVAGIGSVETVAADILADIPLPLMIKEKIRPKRRLRAWEIVLLVLGSPIWLSLLIAAAAVLLSLYVSLWAVIVSLWAAFASVAACGVGGILGGVALTACGEVFAGIALISAGLVCLGLSILFFFGCREATRGVLWLAKKGVYAIKKCFVRKERCDA